MPDVRFFLQPSVSVIPLAATNWTFRHGQMRCRTKVHSGTHWRQPLILGGLATYGVKNITKDCCTLDLKTSEQSGTYDPAAAHQLHIAQSLAVTPAGEALTENLRAEMMEIPGGVFEMGARRSSFPSDLDSPRRKVRVSPFLLAPTTVTNSQFDRFTRETGYRTVAEREGWSFVFHLLLGAELGRWPDSPPDLPWWRKVHGASWSAPEGPGTDVVSRPDHPVVHVTWYDALAYARWSGLRLPREAEWEFAARGGLKNKKFPWGDELMPGGRYAMNTFQGAFPHRNSGDDGWIGTAPADAFAPNGYGLYNMTGNVWEWVQDYFGALPVAGLLPAQDPAGPEDGYARVQRGGSYLCHVSYCDRYHVHSRTQNDPDSSAGNCGFRVAADL